MRRSYLKRRNGDTPAKRAFAALRAKPIKFIRSAKKLKNTAAWYAFSLYIKTRDGFKCITCGAIYHDSRMGTGHFNSASGNLSTFFDERNNNAQCSNCNCYLGGNIAIYAVKLQEKWGVGIIKELAEKARHDHPGFSKEALKNIKYAYAAKLKKLQNK